MNDFCGFILKGHAQRGFRLLKTHLSNTVLRVKQGGIVIQVYLCQNLCFHGYRSSWFVCHNVNKIGESCSHTYELAGI